MLCQNHLSSNDDPAGPEYQTYLQSVCCKTFVTSVWMWRKLLCQHKDISYLAVQTYFLL